MQFHLAAFYHANRHLLRPQDVPLSMSTLDALLSAQQLGDLGGPGRLFELERAMRWRQVVDERGRPSGLSTVRASCVEALVGAVWIHCVRGRAGRARLTCAGRRRLVTILRRANAAAAQRATIVRDGRQRCCRLVRSETRAPARSSVVAVSAIVQLCITTMTIDDHLFMVRATTVRGRAV